MAWLRQRYPKKTAVQVSADTGLDWRRVEKWLTGGSRPDGFAVLSMIAVYGAPFLKAVLADVDGWVSDAARAAALQELDREEARIREKRSKLLGA